MSEKRGGVFITLEGGDGSGKSTQIETIREYFVGHGVEPLFTREPGGTSIGEKLREIVLDPDNEEMTALTEALIYAAARAQHVAEVILPALKEGRVVICDRFIDSSIAYQSFGRGLGEVVSTINEAAIEGAMPDYTLFFDITPEAAEERIGNRDLDRIETQDADFRKRVYEGYKVIAQVDEEMGEERIFVIDASLSKEEVAEKVIDALDKMVVWNTN